MPCAGQLASMLDQEMLENSGVPIASRTTSDSSLPAKSGAVVAQELGGRLLLKYLLSRQQGLLLTGTPNPQFVTPTPFAQDELTSWLALPAPLEKRELVILLRPDRIPLIAGPRWVRFGKGIEYLLPRGFPQEALVLPWEVNIG